MYSVAMLTLAAVFCALPATMNAEEGGLSVSRLTIVETTRIDAKTFEYAIQAKATNKLEKNAKNVSADLYDWPSKVTVINGHVEFGDIAAGETATSQNNLTIRMDRSMAFDGTTLKFSFNYLSPEPSPGYETPPELIEVGALYIGMWPMASGSYDPSLDNRGIKEGTRVYGAYDIDSSYNVTPKELPTDIAGYVLVDSPEKMADGTWCVVTISGTTSYSYVLIMEEAEPSVLTGMTIGATKDTVLQKRSAIELEAGLSVNLTALLELTGSRITSGDRAVEWSYEASTAVDVKSAAITGAFPGLSDGMYAGSTQLCVTGLTPGEFTATATSKYDDAFFASIIVTVVPATPFTVSTQISVTNKGILNWNDGYNPASAGNKFLGFTSDVHYDRTAAAGENLFRLWMENLVKTLNGNTLDYMSFLGDNTSAYGSGIAEKWENIGALMKLADGFNSPERNLFITGNHERWESAGAAFETVVNNPESPYYDLANRIMQTGRHVDATGYAIYSFGSALTPDDAPYYGAGYGGGGAQMFLEEDINALEEYLAKANPQIPVFIIAHYPIHTFTSPEGEDRESGNAPRLIEVLNQHPNVIYLWGHNHSSADPLYDRVLGPGLNNIISIGQLVNGETKRINFFYAAAGCMSDYEYRSSATSTSMPGGVFVEGKGMLAAINGSKITMMWYGRPEEPRPAFKLPPELDSLNALSENTMVWYGGDAYRIFTKGVSTDGARGYTPWYSGTMYTTWTGNAKIMTAGSDIVIVGFRSTSGELLSSGALDALTVSGYGSKVNSAGALEPGSYAVIANTNRTLIFVAMYTFSDGVIRFPGVLPGGVQVLDISKNTITLYDPEKEWDTLTWQDLLDAVMALDTASIVDAAKNPLDSLSAAINGEEGYFLRVGANDYLVKAGEPPPDFQLPPELTEFIKTNDAEYKIWQGYANFNANVSGDGWTNFGGMMTGSTAFGGKIGATGDDVIIVGVRSASFAAGSPSPIGTALAALSIASYGGAPVYHGTNTAGGGAAAEALINAGPYRWVVVTSTSSANGFVVFLPFVLPAELATFVDANNAEYKIWQGYADFNANVSGDGWTNFGGMMTGSTAFGGKIGATGDDVIIVGVRSASFAAGSPSPIGTALAALSIASYGGAPVYHGTNTAGGGAAAEALIDAGPYRWVVITSTSSANGFTVFNLSR